eukprot:TRINITY_DN4161_c0_g1_i3.p1 TRINITY_DN4161_c0_g1~~TRINITY_DN4161_c0_g1_i3.p1  ORF type:complete len:583 (-),score=113.31 TRINITY_DN4161_c0_g1_i3:265-2013(-)
MGKYLWKSYDEVYDIVTSLAKTLQERDLCSSVVEGEHRTRTLGIFCKTREEWVFCWIACWYMSGCIVPLYDTLGEDSITWIVQQAELKTVVTTVPYITSLIKLKKKGKLGLLKNIITLEEPSEEEVREIEKCGMKLYRYHECVQNGRTSKTQLSPDVHPETLATLCYTSGTTAKPKGVMLTHRNYISMSMGVDSLNFIDFTNGESCICWLPLAHVFEQFTVAICLAAGVKMGFFSGDTAKLIDDLQELKPQYFGSVPRVFGKIYEKTTKEIAKLSGFKRWIYNKGVTAKQDYLKATGSSVYSFYDRFVFSKTRNAVGGKVILIFLGGAPISPEVLQMSRIWLCCNIVQGYGQTETTGPILAQRYDDIYPCSIGSTLVHAEGKLIDIPEMGYKSTDTTDGKSTPRGELLVRGGAVSPGYWRNPEMTESTFTKDGWVHTGDVAKISPWGHVTIIDRKKNLFKLAQVVWALICRASTWLLIVWRTSISSVLTWHKSSSPATAIRTMWWRWWCRDTTRWQNGRSRGGWRRTTTRSAGTTSSSWSCCRTWRESPGKRTGMASKSSRTSTSPTLPSPSKTTPCPPPRK